MYTKLLFVRRRWILRCSDGDSKIIIFFKYLLSSEQCLTVCGTSCVAQVDPRREWRKQQLWLCRRALLLLIWPHEMMMCGGLRIIYLPFISTSANKGKIWIMYLHHFIIIFSEDNAEMMYALRTIFGSRP